MSWPDAGFTQTKLRVAKASVAAFPFAAIDIGLAENIFARHDVEIEGISLGGDAKVQQALTADAADIGLGSGPALAFLAKGVPALGVAALANAPAMMALVVPDGSPIKSVADLKGRTIAVTSTGSLTEWCVEQISRQQGWGSDGIHIAALGDATAQVAALRTGQIDGVSGDILSGLRSGAWGHVLLRYDQLVKDFHVQIIYATDGILDRNPDAVRRFLAAWFETIAFMADHKDATVKIAAPIISLDEPNTALLYDAVMPVMSRDGRFNAKALAVLAQSFVDLKQLPAAPDMRKLVTEAYLPPDK
jgi:ABC-type nitrate/sulfonate/bicarbonate transport system substrate-binding protein